jgi:acyl transferase domain-containing protein
MDPQQRLLLERPGRPSNTPASTRLAARQRTGVFVGVIAHDYALRRGRRAGGVEGLPADRQRGSVLSGRVSYVLGP